jgi:hypothetical protein
VRSTHCVRDPKPILEAVPPLVLGIGIPEAKATLSPYAGVESRVYSQRRRLGGENDPMDPGVAAVVAFDLHAILTGGQLRDAVRRDAELSTVDEHRTSRRHALDPEGPMSSVAKLLFCV